MLLDIIKIVSDVGKTFLNNEGDQARFENEVTKKLLSNEAELNKSMAKVMSSDSESESWLTRSIRPITVANMLVLLNAIIFTAIFYPQNVDVIVNALATVPNQLWVVILGGIGLYSFLRSGEKAIKTLKGN